MSEKTAKSRMEDVICNVLNDDVLKGILEFIAYLRENKMNPVRASASSWKIYYKQCLVCTLRLGLDAKTLEINPIINEYKHDVLSDELKEIVWRNYKSHCGDKCHTCSYKLKTIFGRKYDYACGYSVSFINPNASEIECIKKLLEMRRNVIQNGKLMTALPRNFE